MIETIKIMNVDAHFICRSQFFSAKMTSRKDESYLFVPGINILTGDIDSGHWGISYTLGMWEHYPNDIFLDIESASVLVNDTKQNWSNISEHCCYMDQLFPLFQSEKTIKQQVEDGLNNTLSNYSAKDIQDLFAIDNNRYSRPLREVGNSKFRCMAAIGIAYSKSVFCFPWISQRLYSYYGNNISWAISKLSELEKIIIFPTNAEINIET